MIVYSNTTPFIAPASIGHLEILPKIFGEMHVAQPVIAGEKINLSPFCLLFWDVEVETLDPEKHARFIIERVVSRGNRQDWQLLKKVYGKEKIRSEVLRIRSLDKKTLSFLSVYLGVEKAEFRCCG